MLSEAFGLGLSTGAYCAAACFPVALPFIFSETLSGPVANARLVGIFLLGRLVAYALVGYLLGSLGQLAGELAPDGLAHLAPWTYLVLGMLMMGSGLQLRLPRWTFCSWLTHVWHPGGGAFWYGLLTGVNPCPPFLAAAARVFGHGHGLGGAAYFIVFFLGTTLVFLPLLGAAWLQRREPALQAAARVALVGVGAYFALVLGVLKLLKSS